jgi:hypothetical protein
MQHMYVYIVHPQYGQVQAPNCIHCKILPGERDVINQTRTIGSAQLYGFDLSHHAPLLVPCFVARIRTAL